MYIIYIISIYIFTISIQCLSKNISTQTSTIHYYCFRVFQTISELSVNKLSYCQYIIHVAGIRIESSVSLFLSLCIPLTNSCVPSDL